MARWRFVLSHTRIQRALLLLEVSVWSLKFSISRQERQISLFCFEIYRKLTTIRPWRGPPDKTMRTIKRSFSSKNAVARIVHSDVNKEHAHLFSPAFLQFLGAIQGDFKWRWRAVLEQRKTWWKEHATATPALSLRKDTAWIRDDATWKGPPIVPELKRRWVEITGPAGDAKMVINALNSGANCYMSDFEDSQSPTWSGIVHGQQNMYDAARDQLRVEAKGKTYEVKAGGAPPPTLLVRARGLHMVEEHVMDGDGHVLPATLFDYGAYLFHNAGALAAKGARPLLYQPKLESYEEAVFVHDMVQAMEKAVGIPSGTCRITSLIETLPGILQAEEIGFGLGKYWAGLNCGRWDYIFSVLKAQGKNPAMVFPDRSSLTMDKPFLTQYMQRIVQVSHSRGVHAMGGMSAFLPVSTMTADESAKAMAKVRVSKSPTPAHHLSHNVPPPHTPPARSCRTRRTNSPTAATARGWRTQPWSSPSKTSSKRPSTAQTTRSARRRTSTPSSTTPRALRPPRWANSPRRASAPTSTPACITWPRGLGALAPWPSTT